MLLSKSTFNCSTERCREESEYEIETDGNDEDTFKNENISNSDYNRTANTATESLYSTAFTNRKKPHFKKVQKVVTQKQ